MSSNLITLTEWSEKQTSEPQAVFETVFSEVKNWAGITDNSFTLGTMYEYLLHNYGDMLMRDYTKSVLKALTGVWHAANRYKFSGFSASIKQTYNPIENYRRTESETITNSPDLTESVTDTFTPEVTETVEEHRTSGDSGIVETYSTGESSVTGSVAPFDSSTFANADKSEGETSGSETVTTDKTLTDSLTNTRSHSGSDTREVETTKTGTDTTERHNTTAGNIGVTTTQEMLKQEREIVNFVFLDLYLSEWVKAFCTGVWYSEKLC